MEWALLQLVDAFEGTGKRLSEASRGLAFMDDDSLAYLESLESLREGEVVVLTDERAKALWIRTQTPHAAHAHMTAATLAALARYLTSLSAEQYAVLVGRREEKNVPTRCERCCLTNSGRHCCCVSDMEHVTCNM